MITEEDIEAQIRAEEDSAPAAPPPEMEFSKALVPDLMPQTELESEPELGDE